MAPPWAKTEAASPGRSRAQKRVVWSFEAETRRCPSGWKVRAQTFESCAWESVARGGIWGVGAERRGVFKDAFWCDVVVEEVEEDGPVGVGVLVAGEARSQ